MAGSNRLPSKMLQKMSLSEADKKLGKVLIDVAPETWGSTLRILLEEVGSCRW